MLVWWNLQPVLFIVPSAHTGLMLCITCFAALNWLLLPSMKVIRFPTLIATIFPSPTAALKIHVDTHCRRHTNHHHHYNLDPAVTPYSYITRRWASRAEKFVYFVQSSLTAFRTVPNKYLWNKRVPNKHKCLWRLTWRWRCWPGWWGYQGG